MNRSPIQLCNSMREIAYHEAGHIVVAACCGLRHLLVTLNSDGVDATAFTGQAVFEYPKDSNGEVVFSRGVALASLAGLLAQAKVHACDVVPTATFVANQDWRFIVELLINGKTDSSFYLAGEDVEPIEVQARCVGDLVVDLGIVCRHLGLHHRECKDVGMEGVKLLRDCAKLLDRADVWESVGRVADVLLKAPARWVRTVNRNELMTAIQFNAS